MLLTACMPAPHKESVTPEISGRVVDIESKKPIEGATVSLVPFNYLDIEFNYTNVANREPTYTVKTDSDGFFNMPSYKGWYFFFYPIEKSAIHRLYLKFNHPNYGGYVYYWGENFASWEKIPPLNLNDIELYKK